MSFLWLLEDHLLLRAVVYGATRTGRKLRWRLADRRDSGWDVGRANLQEEEEEGIFVNI